MWLGAAIVATGWSGVRDMLDPDNARFREVAAGLLPAPSSIQRV